MNTLFQLLRTMRPPQWVKNLFVLAPVVFAKEHTARDPALVLKALLATGAFILLSGAVYILNDVLDVEKDRLHPVRRLRPVASGALSFQAAVAGGLSALALAFACAAALGTEFTLAAVCYLAQNIFYSSVFKKIAWLDVTSLATGFLLRILAGCFAIGLEPREISYYLILCTFLVALFLALGKRRHELALLGDEAGRSVLRQYRLHHLDLALYAAAAATIAAYAAYTLSDRTIAYFGTRRLVATVPFVVLGIGRYLGLLRRKGDPRSPTDVMIRDVPFVVNIAAWTAMVVWAVYL